MIARSHFRLDRHWGILDGGFGHAFEVSLVQLAVLGAAVTALTWLLPRREAVA
jgi:hypothetical protein